MATINVPTPKDRPLPTDPGRKYRMAYTGLWILTGLTVLAAVGLFVVGEHASAARCVQAGIGSVAGLLAIYIGGQAHVDRHRGEPLGPPSS